MDPFTLKYRGPINFKPELQPNGKYRICGVPIFACHESKDPNYLAKVDPAWMYACVADQQKLKADGFLPRLFVEHTSDDPNAEPKRIIGFLDNYRFDAADKWLYADYTDVEPEDLPLLKQFPGRSAEPKRDRPAIHGVAVLGATPPYFKFPDVRFADGEAICRYSVEIPKMDAKANESNASSPMSPEEKADYEKFCKYMGMYEAGKGTNVPPEPKPGEKPEEKPAEKSGNEPVKPPTKEPAMGEPDKKEPKFSDAEATAKYTELSAKYSALLERAQAQDAKIVALEEAGEKAEWVAKYAETRIPAGRLKIDDHVEMILALPKEKRQKYFDTSVSAFVAPSTKPVDKSDHATSAKPEPGSQEEFDDVRAKYAEWKAKGVVKTYGEAQLKYMREVR